jgi:hypothetical protein
MDALAATTPGSLMSQVGMTMLRKQLDGEQSAALQLIQSLPQVGSPPNLGNTVDVRA